MVAKVVVPWHNPKQRDEFLEAWQVKASDPRLVLQQDTTKAGCAQTKNAGIRQALSLGADVVCVLDDDCYPNHPSETLDDFIEDHIIALEPVAVRMVAPTMRPHPRGMPYRHTSVQMRVAASIGFWMDYPDLDAMSALVLGERPESVSFLRDPLYNMYFPFCGMNFAFKKQWADCAVLIDVPRFDDIWMGWIWQKVAYDAGCCFNFNGPLVRHVRQSNVWKNLEEEVRYLKTNEDLWEACYKAPRGTSPEELRNHFFTPYEPRRIPEGGVGDSPAVS